MRSESALNEAVDSDRCIIIEGTIRACSRTESGTRYAADELVICKVGQSTGPAGSENGTAQQMVQAVGNSGSEQKNETVLGTVMPEQEFALPTSHAISFIFAREESDLEIGDRACQEKCGCSNRPAIRDSLMPERIIIGEM